ncbi:cytochrome c biogenesis protein ResB [Parabacteroides sp. PF5-9]|uniref:cytochrome c biogenesis protein ResB n=1 Tax=Parabacteroides sp. PF5-9 TaxID=1742404 RepID=UPI002474D00F|nr:cytochrome c biogenesis protein ResB [Parabacteroides sp. PF5-9]MDH6357282.1 hypothetical protein [Parabacteroides sp. PF5-9]
MNDKRNMWQFPWRYAESIAFVLGILIVGFVLQAMLGPFDFARLRWPVNGLLGGSILFLSILLAFKRKNPVVQWFSGIPLSVTLISALLLLGILMGLTPQMTHLHPGDRSPAAIFGLRQMTTSWPFVFVYFLLLLSLGTLIVRRLFTFRRGDYAFYLNHLGLWLFLFASGWGAADMKRYVMHVRETETEWRVYNNRNEVLDLPVAIRLNDFRMEEYPPQLVVIDRQTGTVQPENNPQYLQLEEHPITGQLDEWEITVKEYIHEAVRNSDSTYQKAPMPGASPAVKVQARNRINDTVAEGWVCVGNSAQLYMVLPLNEQYCVAMTQPEPKRFVSDINVFTEDGKQTHTLLEVNKPHKVGHWMIYQYGYDQEAGKLSSYSSMELVYDPWIVPVYIGIILMAAGGVCMLWIGNKRKEATDDVE